MPAEQRIALAITGASGVQYALRLLQELLRSGRKVELLISDPARVVFKLEMGMSLPTNSAELAATLLERFDGKPGQLEVYGHKQWTSPLASGSNVPDAMVICPCTSGTLASVASGLSQNLIDRAADVVLKERRKLIMVLRETPLSSIHLQQMLTLSQAGAVIMPASPGFYHQPESLDDVIDFMVARILDQLQIDHELMSRWGSDE